MLPLCQQLCFFFLPTHGLVFLKFILIMQGQMIKTYSCICIFTVHNLIACQYCGGDSCVQLVDYFAQLSLETMIVHALVSFSTDPGQVLQNGQCQFCGRVFVVLLIQYLSSLFFLFTRFIFNGSRLVTYLNLSQDHRGASFSGSLISSSRVMVH